MRPIQRFFCISLILVLPFVKSGLTQLLVVFTQFKYIGELGHNQPLPKSVQFDLQIVASDIEMSGRDDYSRVWKATLPYKSGLGWTTLWTGDFDRNSRLDFLIASHFPRSGRCVDEVTLSFLMITSDGLPNPWIIKTRLAPGVSYSNFPVLINQAEKTKVALLPILNCEYQTGAGGGELTSVEGIYEARQASWVSLNNGNQTYKKLLSNVNANYIQIPQNTIQKDYVATDFSNNLGLDWSAHEFVSEIFQPDSDCSKVKLGTIKNDKLTNPPICEETKTLGFRLSSGQFCSGWPTVVFDRSTGREIIAQSASTLYRSLMVIKAKHLQVALVGERTATTCFPNVMWTRD